jgi:hypothetical protein
MKKVIVLCLVIVPYLVCSLPLVSAVSHDSKENKQNRYNSIVDNLRIRNSFDNHITDGVIINLLLLLIESFLQYAFLLFLFLFVYLS